MDTSKNPNFIPTAALLKNFSSGQHRERFMMIAGFSAFSSCRSSNSLFVVY